MFDIDNIDSDEGKQELHIICREYIKGIFWTFDFYFNKNNSQTNLNKISTWSYKYKRAPLLTQITSYFNNYKKSIRQELESLFLTDISEIIDREKYFTKDEQYLYITPCKKILSCDDLQKYKQFIEINSEFYMDTEEFISRIKDIKEGKNVKKLDVDSKRISYLNKIHLNGLKHIEFKKFSDELNKLNLKEINTKLECYPFIATF